MPLIDHQPRVRPEPQTPLAQNSPQGRPPAWLVVAGVPTFTAFCCLPSAGVAGRSLRGASGQNLDACSDR
jgi:hypothetical protein